MLINVDKIIVKDRIRKDFGDIAELAMDIQDNGLISPIVINKDYVLLAGERRLRAVKRLGWKQVEVRMMDTRDAEHELNIEISENDVRKAFSKSERVDYMYRLMRIEKEKARERQGQRTDIVQTFAESDTGKARDKTAAAFGVSGETMRKEMQIVENKNLLDPADFADWDEGKLSTNKAFQKIKAKVAELEFQNRQLDSANRNLARQVNQGGKTVEKVVEIEVIPDDYEEAKKKAQMFEADNKRLVAESQSKAKELVDAKEQIRKLQSPDSDEALANSAKYGLDHFSIATYDFIRRYGGNVWAFDKWDNIPQETRVNFTKAVQALSAFAQQMTANIEGLE